MSDYRAILNADPINWLIEKDNPFIEYLRKGK